MQQNTMIQTIISCSIFVVALVQWYLIGERTNHAFQQWYHFVGYGDGGQTTMNYETVIFGYATSLVVIFLSAFFNKYFSTNKTANEIRTISAFMLSFGLIWLSILIM